MTTIRNVTYICNQCKGEGVSDPELSEIPTRRYVIMTQPAKGSKEKGRHCTLDLCATHGAPLEVLFQLKPPSGYARVKTGRKRSLPSQAAARRQGGT